MARPIKHPGLNRYARALGVTPGHLSKVASGERPSVELLARYKALVASDPNGTKGMRVSFLPAGTQIADCTPDQLATAQSLGATVTVQGTSITLLQPFTFALGTEGPAIIQPVAGEVPSPAAPR